uniref:GNAT family N-acetyltransferase n=1 Tax=Amycolatopsis sp. CA-096443 TaxID=3239919 RepID=UPI003F492079
MTRYAMRRASGDDVPRVMALLDRRTDWLRDRGSDQWSTRAFAPLMHAAVDRGETWLLWDGDDAVATLTMTTTADPDFWTRDERLVPALYLSKLATDPGRSGEGLGAMLVDWAAGYAGDRGVLWLRWDVWRTNTRLQDYYRGIGGRLLRIVDRPCRHSGALFDLSRAPRALDITTDTAHAPIAALPSRPFVHHATWIDERPTGNPVGRTRVEIVDDWPLPDGLPLSVTPTHRPVLFDAGDGWHVNTFSAQPVETWPPALDPALLRPGHPYRLQLGEAGTGVQLYGDTSR